MTEPRALGEASEEAIVAWFQEDPRSESARRAVSDLFARYRGRVYLWCFRVVHDHERAMDLAQDALLSAYRDLETFRGNSRFSSWLFSIARHRCMSSLRRPMLRSDDSVDPSELIDARPQPDRILEEQLDEESLLQILKRALDPIEQEAIWLRCQERLPVDEITAMLRINAASGARGVLQSARRKLRNALEQRESGDGPVNLGRER